MIQLKTKPSSEYKVSSYLYIYLYVYKERQIHIQGAEAKLGIFQYNNIRPYYKWRLILI